MGLLSIFLSPFNVSVGVTYDRSNDSFWISSVNDGIVANISRAGSVLSSFNTGLSRVVALALDPADDTLWMGNSSGTFFQFTKTGTQLSSFFDLSLTTNVLGAEFNLAAAATGAPEISGTTCAVPLTFWGVAFLVFVGKRRNGCLI